MRSRTDSRRPSRVDAFPARATRGVEHALSYSWWLRIADNIHGFADRKQWGEDVAPLQDRPWVYRLCYTYTENLERLRCSHRDRLAPIVAELHEVWQRLHDADRRLTQLRDSSIGEVSDGVRGRGEAHLDSGAVQSRRIREHGRRQAAHDARAAAVETERDALVVRAAELRSLLEEQHQFLIETAHRLHGYYSRRLGTYARRQGPRVGEFSAALTMPEWVDEPCPWLPSELVEDLAA